MEEDDEVFDSVHRSVAQTESVAFAGGPDPVEVALRTLHFLEWALPALCAGRLACWPDQAIDPVVHSAAVLLDTAREHAAMICDQAGGSADVDTSHLHELR